MLRYLSKSKRSLCFVRLLFDKDTIITREIKLSDLNGNFNQQVFSGLKRHIPVFWYE